MRVLVTGGAGFIGSNLCRSLAHDERIARVQAFDDLSTGDAANLEGVNAELIVGDIRSLSQLREAVDGVDAVVHLAARPSVPRSVTDPIASHEANATGTLNVLEAVRSSPSPPQVILASSSSVYGANRVLPKSEDLRPSPLSPYAASKLAAESYALAHAHTYGLDVLAFRFFNVFGPGQTAGHVYAAVVPSFIASALAGKPLLVHGDGQQTRDFTYIDSVSEVIIDAIVRRIVHPEAVNLAFGGRSSLLELVQMLGEVLGRELQVEFGPARAGDVRDSQADQSRLRSLFPKVEPVDLRVGLERTVTWFQEVFTRA